MFLLQSKLTITKTVFTREMNCTENYLLLFKADSALTETNGSSHKWIQILVKNDKIIQWSERSTESISGR